jgi:TP901 family phage tail tape measure protein
MADDIQSNIRINIDTASAMDSIRLLQNQISAFHTQMAKMGAASAADSRNLQQNLINSINSTGAFSASMVKVRTTAEQFTHSLEKNKLTMGEYFRYAGGASKTFSKLFKSEFETINKVARERVKDLQSQYIKLGRDANGAMQAIKVRPLALDMQNLGTKTQIAAQRQQLLNQLLKQGSTNLLNFGKNTQWAGRQLMVGFTIPLSIMGGAAMKAYQQIEEASIKLKRVYGDLGTTTAETNKMVEQIKQLALEYTKYGVAVKDSMDMAASAAATGKKGADLLAQVNSATKLSVLGGVDQQKALQTTISLTNAFNISSKDLAKNINFLNAVENQTVLNIDDMTTAIPKAAPVIQQLGGDVKDLAFFLTAMKEGGINASEGANALKSGLASLINPTNTASKMLSGFGINIKGIVEKDKGDLKKTVVDFAQALDTLDPLNRARAIEQLFGKFQFARMSTLFKNVIAQGSQASEVLRLAGQSSLELAMLSQKELNKISESPLYKFQKAIADFQAQLAPVGEQFMKAITPLINFGSEVLKNFNGLGEGVKGFIVKFVAVAGIVGPVLLMSFGLIANAVANVIKGFALVKDIFNKTGKSSLSLGEQVNYMTQEQINAAAIASSLDQVHSKLKQTFTSEAAAVDMLTAAYERSVAAQRGFNVPITPRGPIRKYATGGIISGPGTGTSDSILAKVSNGEAIIPASVVARNPHFINQLVSGNIPGFRQGKPGEVPTYAEYGLRLQDARENMSKNASLIRDPAQILSFGALRIGESMGIKPSQASVAKGLFDPIYAKYENIFKVFTNKINSEFETTFANIQNTEERMRLARISAAKFVEKEALQLATTDAEKLALSRTLGLSEDFYGSMPTMPRRAGGKFLERARKSIYSLGSTGVRGYLSLGGGAKTLYERMTGQSGKDFQLGHFNEPKYQSMEALAANPNLSNSAKTALKSVGVQIKTQTEESIVQGVKDATKQASPSKIAEESGQNIGKGAIKGIDASVSQAENAGEQVGRAVATGARRVISEGAFITPAGSQSQNILIPNNTNRRVIADMGYDPVTQSYYPKTETPMTGTMYGPNPATKFQKSRLGKMSTKYNNFFTSAGVNVSKMDPGKFQGRMFGTSMGLGMASMVLPGEAGQIAGMASMVTGVLGMFKNLGPVVGRLIPLFGKLIPYVGLAITAYEAFDKIILPLIKKNADAYSAVTETLKITQDKLTKINDFFGTDIKLTGVRAMQITGSDQTQAQASIAKQFQASDQFKEVYKPQAEKLKSLSDVEVTNALKALAVDLYGQGMEKEQVKAIIDAIKNEAGKEKISISENIFSLNDPKGQAALKQNAQQAAKNFTKEFGGYWSNNGSTIADQITGKGEGFLDTPVFRDQQNLEQLKANAATFGSYLSGLSGQLQTGTISTKTFNIEYEQLIAITNKMPNATGIEFFNAALASLGPEAAKAAEAIKNLTLAEQELVGEAMLKGVTLTQDILNTLEFGGDKQRIQQEKNINNAIKKQDIINSKINEKKKQLTGIQNQTEDIQALEGKINDRYDKRISQIEKLKTLNEQIAKSQQGQLTLAEALNRGDIAAAATAAINIQNNDIQASLDNQKTGLDDARKAEIKPLQDSQAGLSNSVNDLSASIADLTSQLTTNTPVQAGTAPVVEKGLNKKDFNGYLDAGFNITMQQLGGIGDIFNSEFWNNPLQFIANKQKAQLKYLPGYDVVDGKLVPKAAIGGHITGPGSGTSDSIPAMLSNGEYVIRANAVKTIGVNTLDKLNQADRLGFAAGGMVDKFKKKPKPKPYTLDDLAKPITRADDPRWYNYSHNFFEKSLFGYNLGDANKGWYNGRGPSHVKGQRSLVDFKDGTNESASFTSVAGTIKYYKALIESRRLGVPYIDKIAQDNYWTGFIPGRKDLSARNNLIANKMYGNYNGLDKAEAKILASAMSRLWGPDKVAEGFKTLGLNTNLLTKKSMFTDKAQEKAWNSYYTNPNVVNLHPTLSPNTPKYADGGMVRHFKNGGYNGYADGGYIGPRPAPQWDEKGRWVVSHGESYWSTAESTLPGGMEVGSWWSRILKSNIDPETGKERRLYRNSRIWIPGSKEPFPPKSGIPRIFPKKKKPLYTGGGAPISLIENHMYGGNGMGGLLGNMTKLFANGGMVGYAPGGMVKRDTGAPNPFLDPMGWLQGLINGTYAGGGNPSAYLNNTAAKTIKTGAKNTSQFYKDFIFDPTDPIDYAFAAVPGAVKGVGKKAAQAFGFPLVLKTPKKGLKITPTHLLNEAEGATPGAYRIINGEKYYVKRPDTTVETTGEFIGSTIWAKLGLGGPKLQMLNRTTVGSKIIPDLIPSSQGWLRKYINDAPNKVEGANTLAKALRKYIDEALPTNALLGNSDTHGMNILFNKKTKRFENIDLGITSLTAEGQDSVDYLFTKELAQRTSSIVEAMKSSGFNLRQTNDILKKNGLSEISAADFKDAYFFGGFQSSKFTDSLTHKKSLTPQINKIANMLGFDLKKSGLDPINIAAINAKTNPLIQDMIKNNPELAKFMNLTAKTGDMQSGMTGGLRDLFYRLQNASKNPMQKFANGGLVGYKDGGKPKPKPRDPGGLDAYGKWHPSSFFDEPWNNGEWLKIEDPVVRRQRWALAHDDSGLMEFGRTAAYFTPGIGAGMLAGDSATAFGQGDVGGGILNALLAPLGAFGGSLAKFAGKGLGVVGNFLKTGLGIRGGKNALAALGTWADKFYESGVGMVSGTQGIASKVKKLTPTLGFNLSNDALHNMLKDNFYGNMRVPGIRSSTSDSLMNRIAVEQNMMGIPANATSKQTPAYGFLTTKEDMLMTEGSIWNRGKQTPSQQAINNFNQLVNPFSRYVQRYGDNTIKLKPSTLGKATVSMGDSLSIWDQALRLGQRNPGVQKLSSIFSTYPTMHGLLESTQNIMRKEIPGIKTPASFPYIEAHLPGGFTVKDIESIMLNPTDRFGPQAVEKIAADLAERKAALKALLDSLGIKGIGITVNPGKQFIDSVLPSKDSKAPMKNLFGRLFPNRYATGGFVMPNPEPAPTQYANGGMVLNGKFFGGFSRGGMVPSYLAQGGYANGGFAMGTDTVPAMLTPGEFVIKKSAVDRIGSGTLNKINGYADGGLVGGVSAVAGDSVYNSNTYEINVNVSSNSNPDQIANAVMTKIRQIDNGRIRGLNG